MGALLACLFFSLAEAIAIRLQGTVNLPNQFIQLIPYVLTMVALTGIGAAGVATEGVRCGFAKE